MNLVGSYSTRCVLLLTLLDCYSHRPEYAAAAAAPEHGHDEHDHDMHDHGKHGHHEHGHHEHDRHDEDHDTHDHGKHGHHEHGRHEHRHAGHASQPLGGSIQWSLAYASALSMSAISFVGVGLLALLKLPRLGAIVEYASLSFAGTVLCADAFIHLLPHALEGADHEAMEWVGICAVAGCMGVLLIPEALEWQHSHAHGGSESHHDHQVQPMGVANLVTEMLHNFVDGVSLGLSFSSGTPAGIATSIAVAVHELPQELGDFMVLRSAGFSVGRLLFWNFLASLTCVLGVATVHAGFGTAMAMALQKYLLAFTAGSFLALALNMIFPQVSESIRKHHVGVAALRAKLLCFALGVVAVVALVQIGKLEEHDHDHDHAGHGHGAHSDDEHNEHEL